MLRTLIEHAHPVPIRTEAGPKLKGDSGRTGDQAARQGSRRDHHGTRFEQGAAERPADVVVVRSRAGQEYRGHPLQVGRHPSMVPGGGNGARKGVAPDVRSSERDNEDISRAEMANRNQEV